MNINANRIKADIRTAFKLFLIGFERCRPMTIDMKMNLKRGDLTEFRGFVQAAKRGTLEEGEAKMEGPLKERLVVNL